MKKNRDKTTRLDDGPTYTARATQPVLLCSNPYHSPSGPPPSTLLKVSDCVAPAGSWGGSPRRFGRPPIGDVARHSTRACSACAYPSAAFLPPYKASHCNARGLLRQGPSSLRPPAGQPPWSGRQRRLYGVPGRPRCWRTAVAGPARAGGTGGARACRTRRGRGLAGSVVAACPHTPRRSLRSTVGRLVFYCWAVCCRAPGAGACSFP